MEWENPMGKNYVLRLNLIREKLEKRIISTKRRKTFSKLKGGL